MVEGRVWPQSGDHAGGQADHERNQQRPETEFEGRGEGLGNDLVDGAVGVAEGGTEVAAQHIAEIVHILNGEGIVQPVVAVQLLDGFGGKTLFLQEGPARR